MIANLFLEGQVPPLASDIRIHSSEYDRIQPRGGVFTHFNLAVAGHVIGESYVLSRIVAHGVDGPKPRVPQLDYRDCWVGTCIGFCERVDVDDVIGSVFETSMSHILSRRALQSAIFSRYGKSRPYLSHNEMMDMGVSITKLTMVGKTDDHGLYRPF